MKVLLLTLQLEVYLRSFSINVQVLLLTFNQQSAGETKPQIFPRIIRPDLVGENPVGVFFVQGEEYALNSPQCRGVDPLEGNTLIGTPQILPDVVIEETYSTIEDRTVNLSKTTPLPKEESLLPDVVTPYHDSPFRVETDSSSRTDYSPTTYSPRTELFCTDVPMNTSTPTNPPNMVQATYSRSSTPDT